MPYTTVSAVKLDYLIGKLTDTMCVFLTHDFESNGINDSSSECLVRSVALIDNVIVTLRNHDIHLRGRHEATL